MRALQAACYFTEFAMFGIKYFVQNKRKGKILDWALLLLLFCPVETCCYMTKVSYF